MKRQLGLLIAVIAATASGQAFSGTIIWNSPQAVTGDSDISTRGSFLDAVQSLGGEPARTIGDTLFSAVTYTAGGPLSFNGASASNGITFSVDAATTGFGTGVGSANYQAVINQLAYAFAPTGGSINLNNLTANRIYQVQVWTVQNGVTTNPTTYTSGLSAVTNQSFPAQQVLGTFQATGTSQSFTYSNPSTNPIFNAIALRDVTPSPITWGAASQITGDSDVSTTGTLDRAFNFGFDGAFSTLPPGPTAVNGVTFQPFLTNGGSPVITKGNTNVLTGDATVVSGFNDFSSTAAPYSGLTPAYKDIVRTGLFNDATDTLVVNLDGLTAGTTYQVQLWFNESRDLGGVDRAAIVADATGANTVVVDYNTTPGSVSGGLGQYVIGTFTANSSLRQIISINGINAAGAAYLNALQLRVIPEPSSALLMLLGVAGMFRVGRRMRSR